MKTIILFIFTLFTLPKAYTQEWRSFVTQAMPKNYQKFIIGKTTQNDAEKWIGKAQLIEGNKHYYIVNGFKYAVEIVYKDQVVSELFFTFKDNRPSLEKISIDISKTTPAMSGKFMKHIEEHGELFIDPKKQNVYAVRFK